MRQPEFSVLIPHYAAEHGRRTLRTCLDCLIDNTASHYELIVYGNSEGGDLYQIYNDMARRASTEWIVFLMSDEFLQPGWDIPALEYRSPDILWGFNIVEPGYEPVNALNARADFGASPETFQRHAFETWCMTERPSSEFLWIFPWFMSREAFFDLGGFPKRALDDPEWGLSDMLYCRTWVEQGGQVGRLPTWAYHLGRWSLTGQTR